MRRLRLGALLLPLRLLLHPMHASVTELVHDPASKSVAITLRIFADDFSLVGGIDSLALPYLRANLTLADVNGRPIPLRWEGGSRSGDVVWLRLRADVPAGLGGLQVRNAILCDRFEDEVNVVRASYGGRTASLLFTRGDRAKALP